MSMDQSEMDEADSAVARDIAREVEDLPERWYDSGIPEQETIPAQSFWQRLLNGLWPSPKERYNRQQQRLEELNQALVHHPETPANYVLRGELYLEMGEAERAADDFSRALGIASAQVETDDWGFISQVMQDRAEIGLANADRILEDRHAEHRQYDDF